MKRNSVFQTAVYIPVLIQDRAFRADGSLCYPTVGVRPDIHPNWVPEWFANMAVVNGKVWPYLEVEPRRYRFRFLNGCNARFLRLRLSNGQGMTLIGVDGGLLAAPIDARPIPHGTSRARGSCH